jgi:iron(III) transport system ATP-binding protein
MVFQDLALWPHLSVHGNVAFALDARAAPRQDRDRRVAAALDRVGLGALAARLPATLSGGERQRVAIARALVTDPDLVLFDEALTSLDVALKEEVLALLEALFRERGCAALVVSHDPREARRLAAKVTILEAARVVQTGTLEELARDPRTAFVRAFAAAT